MERVLLYGMQSSGASLLALLVAQIPSSVAVVDLWAPFTAPPLRLEVDAIVKATIGEVGLESHLGSFHPTVTVLLLRDPVDVVASLETKSYRDYGGTIEQKLQKYDRTFVDRELFDVVLRYEELVRDPLAVIGVLQRANLPVPEKRPLFSRTAADIVSFSRSNSAWCDRYYRSRWGIGNAHTDHLSELRRMPQVRTRESRELAEMYCPGALAYYDGMRDKESAL